jgi:alcohol dehydrogenase class IV
MREFTYVGYAQQIIFGEGTAQKLGAVVGRFGWRRLVLCTTGSQRRAGHADAIEAALIERLVATFDHCQPHVPASQVEDVLALTAAHDADAIVGLGGGSAIGMAKAVAAALETQRTGRAAQAAHPTDQPLVPVIAIPTTYAGSEMTAVYGITHPAEGANPSRKLTVSDPKIAPKLVIYDPALTLDLPPELTASTGINALAHCVEALYSVTRNPTSSAVALAGTRCIGHALPRCYADGADADARAEMLEGAYLAGSALAHVAMALHHGVCHVLGGTVGVPHGVANAIILPHAMRFNLDATAGQLAQVATAIDPAISGDSTAAVAAAGIDRVAALIRELGLPQRLRDVGVAGSDLPQLARLAVASSAVRNNPKPVKDAAELEALLRDAW